MSLMFSTRWLTSTFLLFFSALAVGQTPVLKILNWEEYLSEEIVAEFEKKHQVKVELFYFEHDEERDEILATRNGTGFDLVIVDGQSLPGYARLGWLAPLTEKEVPNLKHLEDRWQTYTPNAVSLAMPYGWGSYGIAYRSDLVSQPVTSYRQLFNPVEELRGKIIMSPQALELIPCTLKTIGHSMNSLSSEALEEARQLLKEQQPYVHSYQSVKLSEDSPLVTGEAVAAMVYSGDAMVLKEYNKNIVYTDAAEGQILWFDYWVVLNSSANKKLAYDFLNFLQQPDINARNTEATYTATFNQEAFKLLPEEMKENPAVFPKIKSNAEYFIEPAPRVVRQIMSIWHQLNIQ